MSKYYTPQRQRGLYVPEELCKLSRSKIDLFIECPRCFYLDLKYGIARPPGYPFTLNSAVDTLLKKEFDFHRANGTKHPLIEKYGIDAHPVSHEKLDQWRHTFTGVQCIHKPTNFLIYGAIDDLWQDSEGNYIVVDYKATSKNKEINELNEEWHKAYKRQMEVYQWLLRQNGCKVSDTGYFVYCNGKSDLKAFDAKLEFDITLIPYTGNDSWIKPTLFEIHKCLNSDEVPEGNPDCDYCRYIQTLNSKVK
jgi:CRISPR/Cas system-associated exonuclease Cas4 (RecB family)